MKALREGAAFFYRSGNIGNRISYVVMLSATGYVRLIVGREQSDGSEKGREYLFNNLKEMQGIRPITRRKVWEELDEGCKPDDLAKPEFIEISITCHE